MVSIRKKSKKNKIPKVEIYDLPKLTDLVDYTVKCFFRKNHPRFMYLAFGDLEDARQVAWARLLEVVKAREIIAKPIAGKEPILATIIKRGLIDYMRTQLGTQYGRHSKDGKYKKNRTLDGMLATSYYMNYYEGEEGGFVDLGIQDTSVDVESDAIRNSLVAQIHDFMAAKLNPKNAIIMRMWMEDKLTMKEIAKKMYLTESRVSQIIQRSTNELKDHAWHSGYQN